MSHRRVKAIDYDEDDYFDNEDAFEELQDQGPSAEDKEQLRLGTIEVRRELGTSFDASDLEIQEALWYYYYDLGKTITYIKNKRKPTPSKTSEKAKANTTLASQTVKPASRLHNERSSLSLSHNPTISKGPRPPKSLLVSDSGLDASLFHPILLNSDKNCSMLLARDFFHDCPWLCIPPKRKADIKIEPLYQRCGLLGGSPANAQPPKMSKLAALAAKRREEKERSGRHIAKAESQGANDVSASLQRLKLNNITNQDHLAKRRKLVESGRARANAHTQPVPLETPPDKPASTTDQSKNEEQSGTESMTTLPKPSLAVNATPSMFAKTLLVGAGLRHSSPPANGFDSRQIFYGTSAKIYDFAEPSPDDKVKDAQKGNKSSFASTKAQSHGTVAPFKRTSKPTPPDHKAHNEEPSTAIGDLSLQDQVEHVTSKNIDILAEYNKRSRKNAVNIVVVGHVDSGKSTLMGNILVETGNIDKRTIEVYKREAEKTGKGSFALAWILDQGNEERERGVTMDISTNKFSTEKTDFTILDAPGHRDFVPNMIAGTSQADLAVLVVDASTGEFESGMKGQTREHALLVRSIGVGKVIVAVNKMDLANWSQVRFEEIEQQMSAFLATAGFQPKNLSFVPCSGLKGSNVLTKLAIPGAAWYIGPTLVSALDATEPREHAIESPLRMTITDVFSSSSQNPLSIAGRLESGSLQLGDTILIQPSGATGRIKSLDVNDESAEWAVAGDNVVLNLTAIESNLISEGFVVCSPQSPIRNVTSFSAKLLVFEHLTPMFVTVHRGRQAMEAKVSKLLSILDKGSNEVSRRKPKLIKPGEWARAEVAFLGGDKQPLDKGARIVLRSGGTTIAAGLVE